MAFSKDDRKNVFNFFEKILLEFEKPVYFELLRGHVSKAKCVVKEYVHKNCKGENLLNYFEKRKNYFDVNLRKEVSLKKDRYKLLRRKSSEISKIYESDEACNFDENNDNQCPILSKNSSSLSPKNFARSVSNEYPLNIDSLNMVKDDLEELSLVYFRNLLEREKKLKIETLQMKKISKNVQSFLSKYMKNDVFQFLKDNPQIFCTDDNFVWLVDSPVTGDTACKIEHVPGSQHEKEESCDLSDNKVENTKSFFRCAEFFISVLKKKRSIPLCHLSGSLSRAPSDVSEYLNLNYSTFKDFLLDANFLFTLSEQNEVSLAKNYFKKLSDYKSDTRLSLQDKIKTQFHTEPAIKRINDPETVERKSCSKISSSESQNLNVSNDDVFYSSNETFENMSENFKMIETAANKSFQKTKLSSDQSAEFDDCNEVYEDESAQDVSDLRSNIGQNYEIEESNTIKPVIYECDLVKKEIKNSTKSVLLYDRWNTQRNFIKCAFTVQLLCLEIIEKETVLSLNSDYETVKFFVEILEEHPLETFHIDSLRGRLGQATSSVHFFLKQLYKGEKINLFFQKHDEFIVNSSSMFVQLSPSYTECLEEKKNVYQAVRRGEKMYKVSNLYNSLLHELFVHIIDCVSKICCFLQNKSKIKLSRMQGIYSKFSATQQEFINSLKGSEITDKLKIFLKYFTIFFVSDTHVEINPEMDVSLLVCSITKFSEKLHLLNRCDKSKLPCFGHLSNYFTTYENDIVSFDTDDLRHNIIQFALNFLSYSLSFSYSDLPSIVGHEILLSLVLEKKDSQSIIQILEENALFNLKNGEVFLKKESQGEEIFSEDTSSQNEKGTKRESSEQFDSDINVGINYPVGDEVLNEPVKLKELASDVDCISVEIEHCEVNTLTGFSEELNNSEIPNNNVAEINSDANLFHLLATQADNEVCDLASFFRPFEEKLNVEAFNQASNSDLEFSNDFAVHEEKFVNDSPTFPHKELHDSEFASTAESTELSFATKSGIENDSGNTLSREPVFLKDGPRLPSESSFVRNVEKKNSHTEDIQSSFKRNNANLVENKHTLRNLGKQFYRKEIDIKNSIVQGVMKAKVPKSIPYDKKNKEKVDNCKDTGISTFFSICAQNECEITFPENESLNKEVLDIKYPSCSDVDNEDSSRNISVHENSKSNNKLSGITLNSILKENKQNLLKYHNEQDKFQTVNYLNKKSTEIHTDPIQRVGDVSELEGEEKNPLMDQPQQNLYPFFLQPLQAKIILLTLDSCIVETIIEGYRKYIFCLKSSFHCEQHSICQKCFDSLAVGDEVACFIPSNEDFINRSMCFSFLFCKELNKREKETELHSVFPGDNNWEKCISKISTEKEFSSNHAYSNKKTKNLKIGESQTIISGELKPSCPIAEKECQVEYSIASQGTQTVNKSSEIECQTVLTGSIKLCPTVMDKACLVRCAADSRSTQTVYDSVEKVCQTNICGSFKPCSNASSSGCQTEASSGEVKLVDGSCQTVPFSTLISDTMQAITEYDDASREMTIDSLPIDDTSSAIDAAVQCEFSASIRETFRNICDIACQTMSTGPIMIKKCYL